METNQSFSVVLLFFLLHSFTSCSSLSTKNIVTDGDALLALKASVTHDPNNLLTSNWSIRNSVCNWIGVTCSVRHRRVTRLDISLFGLAGTIPPQLGNLSFLAVLNISNNSFYGSLPDEFSHLHRLLYIDLRHNQISGTVPSSIFNISSLREVRLKGNQLSSFANMSGGGPNNLTYLGLSNNMFEGEIPSFILKFKQLQILGLAYNNFKGGIPKEIGNLTKLKELYIGDNKLQGTIPSNLWKCRELTRVVLAHNQLRGRIPREIGNLTSLKYLSLAFNNLIGGIPNEIGSIPNLEVLELVVNNLDGHVPATIFNISTLKWLTLASNKLSGSLPSSIGLGIPNIEEFNVALNYFSGTFPNFITNASRLHFLEMSGNSFSGFVPSTLGNGLTSLQILNLGDNNFTSATTDLSFLTSLTNCKNLIRAAFYFNPLNGFLPTSIGNLSHSLETLHLGSCNISGNIPQEIGNLKNLMSLILVGNEFTGSIPATIGNLKQLQGLFLQLNKLEGSIPNDLCLSDKFVELSLGNNKLAGAIPPCFGRMTSLRTLSLSSNGLTSVIPPSLGNLKDILHIDLSSNSLTGTLPSAFGNLKAVIDVDLSRNHLTDEIPTTMGGLENLQNLSLRYNSLKGSIPESFGRLISLKFLDLSNNNLSGVIPKSLEALSYLKYLNLSFNQLEGNIPTEGPFSNFSAKSFIMNHALCGLPRLQVPPCKTNTRPKFRITVVLTITLLLTFIVSVTLIIVMREYQKRRSSQLANNNDVDVSQRAIWRRISYQELVQATEGFSESNLLGRGGFGSVFRGKLSDGMEIAVKVFHVQIERALRSFNVECELFSSIRHRNLIKIISSCTNEDLKALVLEYMPNGSLEKCLYSNEFFLNMLQRLNILIDVASALEYLHFDYSIPIVHCDVKPSNVLLDQDMVGHLSDFGIAKLLGEEESMTQTLATVGYMAPEYGREGRVSVEGDVYSYGIMLMETFTKKKPTDEVFTEEMSLRHWVGDSFNRSIIEVVDNNLLTMEDAYFLMREQCLSSIVSLAMDCTRDLPHDRINIRNVVSRFIQIKATFSPGTRGGHVRVR
ncbi:hypothetical protein JRO89_XS02G0287000 [Xanthoceras sorbifolium]|uniref:Protein kinase domain-containing protein n=1 Tax=Xanthoceras sorbifolium TaxID=99658 RepID=A0ABQ8IHG1_9ROSI|nr:hypothetical protein JRO89_XS02G0287000 [Xanthoceras sorbifolium]